MATENTHVSHPARVAVGTLVTPGSPIGTKPYVEGYWRGLALFIGNDGQTHFSESQRQPEPATEMMDADDRDERNRRRHRALASELRRAALTIASGISKWLSATTPTRATSPW